jgi:hypothetical protein
MAAEIGPSFDEPLEDFGEFTPPIPSKVAENPTKYRAHNPHRMGIFRPKVEHR